MKNGELARALCFQESAEEGNADSIAGRWYQCFPSCFQALTSKNEKILAMDPLLCYNITNAGMARLF